MKFRDFNCLVNPNNEKCYIVTVVGKAPKIVDYTTAVKIGSRDPTLTISWIVPKNFIVLETGELNLAEVITATDAPVLAYKNPNRMFIVAKSTFNARTTNNLLACGITANTHSHTKNPTSVMLPFKPPTSIAPELEHLEIIHGPTIEDLPSWLKPLRKISKAVADGLSIPINMNEQAILLNILSKIKGEPKTKQEEILKLVNKYFMTTPVSDLILSSLLDTSQDMIASRFFDKDAFLHNKMGDYIIENCNIKRDKRSRELFYFNDVEKIFSSDTDYIMGYMTRLVPKLKNYQKEEVVKYISNYLYEEAVDMNSNKYTVVFKNGILDITTMKFEPMSPDHLESIKINANYNPNASSHIADSFFDTVTTGNKDIETLLYEAIGYAMLKTNALQKGFILLGPVGRNGKSTYFDLVRSVLGQWNTESISFKDLSSNFRLSTLTGKLASLAGDVSAQPLSDTDLVKSITSGEPVTLEQKYKQSYSGELFSTMFFACNKLPKTPDTTEGFYRRWTIIPFLADLSKVSRVQGLKFASKLLSQDSIDYVAYRAVQAIVNVFNTTEEFTEPIAVKRMMEKYRIENSTILSWFADELNNNTKKLEKMELRDAYVSYAAWCVGANRPKSGLTTFTNALKSDIGIDLQKK